LREKLKTSSGIRIAKAEKSADGVKGMVYEERV
jgi:hypothetical protein